MHVMPDAVPEFVSSLRPSQLPDMALHCPADLGAVFEHMRHGAKVLAGGTDILPMATHRGAPDYLVWVGGVGAMQAFDLDSDDGVIRIGAATTLARMVRSLSFRTGAPAVADGARVVGSVQLRNQATVAGNVCTASPAADTLPGLLVHDCVVETLNSNSQRRRINLKNFMIGPGKTALDESELVSGLSLSRLKANQASAFQRFTQRKALDLAFASVAAMLEFEADGQTLKAARLALGAVGPTVIDATEAAEILVGHPLDDARLGKCADAASQLCAPLSDHRASADYRRQLIRTLTGDVVKQAAERYGARS